MVHALPLTAQCTEKIISLDAHVANVANNGRLLVFRVASASLHPRVFPGDLLLVEDLGADYDYHDKHMLLFYYDGKYLMRQKKFIAAGLKRSHLHVVGKPDTHPHSIRVIGRLLGWLSGGKTY